MLSFYLDRNKIFLGGSYENLTATGGKLVTTNFLNKLTQ